MHNNGCQSVLRDRHYDGIWYRRVGKWLHYMEKTYQEWHSLLRRARVWITSADQHYQRHNRRVQLFSVMSQLWASERAAHRIESPLPKRHCRTRPGILGQRPPPDMAPAKRRKLVTLEDLWGMAHT